MKEIYQFLSAHYNIRQSADPERVIAKFTEHRLERFLENYVTLAGKRQLEPKRALGFTDIYPDSFGAPLPFELIHQFSIYANRIYVHDPLLKFALEWRYIDDVNSGYINRAKTRAGMIDVFKVDVINAIKMLLYLRPLAENKIVYFVPSGLREARRTPNALYSDDFYSASGPLLSAERPKLPAQVERYSEENLVVYPGLVQTRKMRPVLEQPISLDDSFTTDKIFMGFSSDPFLWNFHLATNVSVAEEGIMRGLYAYAPNQDVEINMFRNWVKDKKLQVTFKRLNDVTSDLTLASALGATYLTNLPVSSDIAQMEIGEEDTTSNAQVIRALLNLDLPFFENARLDTIVKARQNEAEFHEFVSMLEEAFGEIAALPKDANYQARIEEIGRDTLLLPTERIQKRMKILKRNLAVDAAISIGTLVTSFITGQTVIGAAIASGYALLQMYKQNKTEEDAIRQDPSFFYWKATHSK